MKRVQEIRLFLKHTKRCAVLWGFLLWISVPAMAQGPLLNQTYSFSKTSYSVYELAAAMQQQADISISYDARQIPSKTMVRLHKQSMNTKELAVLLNKYYSIQIKIIGRHILLQREVAALARNKPKKKKSVPVKTTARAFRPAVKVPTVAPVNAPPQPKTPEIPDFAALDTLSSFPDTFTIDKALLDRTGWEIGAVSSFANLNKDIDRLDAPAVLSFNPGWYERFGLSVQLYGDEIFFLNPLLSLHWGRFAASGSYAIRGPLSHFRFGLSYTHPVSATFNISVWADYGRVPTREQMFRYQYDSFYVTPPDSLNSITISGNIAYNLSGAMIKGGINLDWCLGERLDLFAGLSFSRIETRISRDGAPWTPRVSIPPAVAVTEESFRLVPKLFDLYNNFSADRSAYTRSWIGFRVGFKFYLFRPERNFP